MRACIHCGGPLIWPEFDEQGPTHIRLCQECLHGDDLQECYGYELCELPAEEVEIDKKHIPLRAADRCSGPGSSPEWELRGRTLYIKKHEFLVPLYSRKIPCGD